MLCREIMQTKEIKRTYKEKDIKKLISKAGGRCCYRYNGEICKRLLYSNNSIIGEKAHIVAVSKKGPRFDPDYNEATINSYENLMWMCPTHHTMIDKIDDIEIYTVELLLKMKEKHEKDVLHGNFSTYITLYDAVIHDYSLLSTLFEYVDINKLYSSSLDLPFKFDHEFLDLTEMHELYEQGIGPFILKDRYLNKLFATLLNSTKQLLQRVEQYYYIEYILEEDGPIKQFKCTPLEGTTEKERDWVVYWQGWYQESVDLFISAMQKRYPEIFIQPVFKG